MLLRYTFQVHLQCKLDRPVSFLQHRQSILIMPSWQLQEPEEGCLKKLDRIYWEYEIHYKFSCTPTYHPFPWIPISLWRQHGKWTVISHSLLKFSKQHYFNTYWKRWDYWNRYRLTIVRRGSICPGSIPESSCSIYIRWNKFRCQLQHQLDPSSEKWADLWRV